MIATCILQSIHRAQRLETAYCRLLKQFLNECNIPLWSLFPDIAPASLDDAGERCRWRRRSERVDVSMQGRVGFFLMQSLMFTESFNVLWVQQRLPYRTALSIILPNAIHFRCNVSPISHVQPSHALGIHHAYNFPSPSSSLIQASSHSQSQTELYTHDQPPFPLFFFTSTLLLPH